MDGASKKEEAGSQAVQVTGANDVVDIDEASDSEGSGIRAASYGEANATSSRGSKKRKSQIPDSSSGTDSESNAVLSGGRRMRGNLSKVLNYDSGETDGEDIIVDEEVSDEEEDAIMETQNSFIVSDDSE
ncbi:hypothetical protein AYI70_g1326 [Smittium culicis]|uniref:Histone chaperone domain-containing protein n=1 Tax=Smittium culicis TaxID=133412 RepID=A0A1R1YD26_9FUNG|nr:hypothetical protein AYI70_g1326 [Smittium culicis]